VRAFFLVLPTLALLGACQSDPDWANKAALKIGAPRPDAAEIRARQSETFPNISEQVLLVEATQVLQDLGFTIEESVPRYGVLAGGKDRDATETGQVAGQVALTIGLAVLGVRYNPVWDTDQVIRATITTYPVGKNAAQLRISFERIVTNNHGVSRVEDLTSGEFSKGSLINCGLGLRKMHKIWGLLLAAATATPIAACSMGPPPTEFIPSKKSAVELRAAQARLITGDEDVVMRGVVATLHDLGYRITKVEAGAGTVSATRQTELRMAVVVRPKDATESVVRANATIVAVNREAQVDSAEFYEKDFFDELGANLQRNIAAVPDDMTPPEAIRPTPELNTASERKAAPRTNSAAVSKSATGS
jgi:hypothetical protein